MNSADIASLKAPLAPKLWATTPVFWENDQFTPPEPPSAFVFAEIRGLKGDLIGVGQVGNQTWQDDGFLRLHVYVPVQQGRDGAQTIVDSLAPLYRGLKLGNVQCMETTPPDPGNGSDPQGNGNWFSLSFSVRFYTIFNG